MPRYSILALLTAALLFIGCGSDDNPVAPNVQPPTDLTATIRPNFSVRLNWADNSQNEQGFRIERASAGGNFTAIADVPLNTTQYTDSGLVEGDAYRYRVAAFNGPTVSAPTDILPVAIPLVIPTGFTVRRESTTAIRLTWTDNSTSETGYQIENKVRGDTLGYQLITTLPANSVGYLHEGLTPATTYEYRMRAVKDTVGSEWLLGVATTTVLTPRPPTNLVASTSSSRPNAVTLEWREVGSEQGYVIEKSLSEFQNWEVADSVGADYSRVTIRELTSETVYFFRVYAYNVHGVSDYSNIVAIEVPGIPQAPSGLTATANDWRGVDLRWVDNSRNEEEFFIERRTPPANDWQRKATRGADTTIWFDATVLQNMTYGYRVQASNDAGASAFSEEVQITTPDGPPAGPTNLTASNGYDIDKIILSWRDVANNEDSYFLERRLPGEESFEFVAGLAANAQIYTDTALVPETAYEYRVFCMNDIGSSPNSNVATGRTKSLLLLREGFENYLTNSTPGAPWQTNINGGAVLAVNNQANQGEKSLMIRDPDPVTNGQVALATHTQIRNGSTRVFVRMPPNAAVRFLAGDASANQYITWEIRLLPNNSIVARDGVAFVTIQETYPIGEWFELGAEFNSDSGKYVVTFNGDVISDSLGYQRTDHLANGLVGFTTFTDTNLLDGFFDDIEIRYFYQPQQRMSIPRGREQRRIEMYSSQGTDRITDPVSLKSMPAR